MSVPIGSALPRSLPLKNQTIARGKIRDATVQCSSSQISVRGSQTNDYGNGMTLIKRRDMFSLTLGLSSFVIGSFDAEGAGLPPEEKPRLCDDACETELENVWWDYIAPSFIYITWHMVQIHCLSYVFPSFSGKKRLFLWYSLKVYRILSQGITDKNLRATFGLQVGIMGYILFILDIIVVQMGDY